MHHGIEEVGIASHGGLTADEAVVGAHLPRPRFEDARISPGRGARRVARPDP